MTHHRLLTLCLCAAAALVAVGDKTTQAAVLYSGEDPLPTADGYHGIWYSNQAQGDEYVYKYSGGLGTYCAKHRPFAIYAEEVDKTFFVYGGTNESGSTLLHMVSYYDHATGTVPKPRILLDKQTTDAHDNPVMSIDDDGYIWVFSSTHGSAATSYLHRSKEPYDIDSFVQVDISELGDNYSYTQPYYLPGQGFHFLHTHYDGGQRNIYQTTSPDGQAWTSRELLSAIENGHYEVVGANGNKVGSAFNMHPTSDPYFGRGTGLNYRTNLYYMESDDFGATWTNAQGQTLSTPMLNRNNPALVHDYQAEGLNVYMKDIQYDSAGNPVILYLTSGGWESGPDNGPRTWRTARWTGAEWDLRNVTTSDNNYDMGTLYLESDNLWRLIAPTETGPQAYNTGGEIAMWTSTDRGATWTMEKQLTHDSLYNHTYARGPLDAEADFYALWADGHGRRKSESRLYFTDRDGRQVWRLPTRMTGDFAQADPVHGTSESRYASAVQGHAPVGYWRMEEYSGATIANSGSAAALDGTIEGDTVPDISGPHVVAPGGDLASNSAALFDGAGDYIRVEDPGTDSVLDFGLGDSITLEAWVDADPSESGYRYIIGKGRTGDVSLSNQNYAMRLCYRDEENPARLGFIFRDSSNTQWNLWETDASVAPGWRHVALTFTFGEADSVAGYIDGEQQAGNWLERADFGDGGDAPLEDDDALWIGSAQNGGAGSSFDGRIDEAALYREALSAEELLAHFLAAAALEGDLNGDGFVGGDDLDVIRSHWGEAVAPGDLAAGDASGDGFVGGDDLDVVRAHWGSGAPAAVGAVPEPSTMALILTGALAGFVAWRRRR